MTDASKFAEYSNKAKENLDQIKTSLLRHDRNPKDREFLNDILKSINSIKSAAIPLGLSRTIELCHHLESLINLIKEEKKELHQEIILVFSSSRERLGKLIFELETLQMERSKVKDLVRKIKEEIEEYNRRPDGHPEEQATSEKTATSESVDKPDDRSLLPDEILNKDYDKELYHIYVDQLQENISLLRALTDRFDEKSNKQNTINQCSDLVDKLQSSANYMGYDKLANFYLQWVAELEMTGVDLSLGTTISFAFMDEKIKKIVGLFPDLEDVPADDSTLKRIEQRIAQSQDEKKTQQRRSEEETAPQNESGQPGEIEPAAALAGAEPLDEDEEEPVAALADAEPLQEEEPVAALDGMEESTEPVSRRKGGAGKKEARGKKIIEIDGSFLEEEQQSGDYDEELFQIFVDQLKENLTQINRLVENFPTADNKPQIIDQCSNMVGKLQSSANYMGYERLAEYYLQWIAELEMAGVEISLGTDVTLDFMAERIAKITSLFLEKDRTSKTSEKPVTEQAPPQPEPAKEKEPAPAKAIEPEIEEEKKEDETLVLDDSEMEGSDFDFSDAEGMQLGSLFTNIEESSEEDSDFEDSFDAIAGIRGEIEEEEETEVIPVKEYDDIHLDDDEEEEPLAEGVEPIAGLSDKGFLDEIDGELTPPLEERLREPESELTESGEKSFGAQFSDALEEKLESFFEDVGEPEEDDDLESSFMEIASLSDDTELDEYEDETKAKGLEKPAGRKPAVDEDIHDEVAALFDESMEGEEEPAAAAETEEEEPAGAVAELFEEEDEEAEPAGEFAEAVDDHMESFFTDMEEPEGEEEPAAAAEAEEEEPAGAIAELFEEEDEEAEAEPEEELSDEELLREIQGPTVGLEAFPESEQFIPDIDAADEAVSAISEGELTEEELFSKLEGAISADEPVPVESEEQAGDEGDFEEITDITEEVIETAPERKELYQKLSHALLELEEESEDTEEQEPETETSYDSGLFDRLTDALEDTKTVDISSPRPIDQVMEEILSGRIAETEESQTVFDSAPNKLAAAEIKQIIRMDSDKVDSLLDRFSELNTNRSALTQVLAEMNDLHQHYQDIEGFSKQELKPLKDLIFRLGDTSVSLQRVANEIREGIIRVRMVPISLLFDRYEDFVEKLAKKSNKKVEIEIVGNDTELEKIILDEISEPLTQLVSNAVEHGIETMDQRKKLGKNIAGTLKLEAYQEESDIVIEIMDDGFGIDLSQVKARAMDIGLYTGDELYKMSEKDLKNIIMEPGFSFTDSRGEGLHIVRTSVENIHGSIDIRSSAGKGTIIQVRVPYSLLIVKALKVKVGKEVMALPVTNIEEIIRMHPDKLQENEGKQSINWDETTIPVFRLSSVFKIEPGETKREKLDIILVRPKLSTERIGLIVDETAGLEEIIIKPIGETLRKKSGFAGVTIIDEGGITLIPDIDEVVNIATEHPEAVQETTA